MKALAHSAYILSSQSSRDPCTSIKKQLKIEFGLSLIARARQAKIPLTNCLL